MARDVRERAAALRAGARGRLGLWRRAPTSTETTPAAAERVELLSWMPPDAPLERVETPAPDPGNARLDAVLAYCCCLLDPPADREAARDVNATFEQDIAADTGDGDEGRLLLALTRLMAAVSLPDHSTPGDRRSAVRASLGDQGRCTCRESGGLLATAANGTIEERQRRALELHLDGCAECRDLQARMAAAEAAFARALERGRSTTRASRRPAAGVVAGLAAALVLGAAAAALLGGGTAGRAGGGGTADRAGSGGAMGARLEAARMATGRDQHAPRTQSLRYRGSHRGGHRAAARRPGRNRRGPVTTTLTVSSGLSSGTTELARGATTTGAPAAPRPGRRRSRPRRTGTTPSRRPAPSTTPSSTPSTTTSPLAAPPPTITAPPPPPTTTTPPPTTTTVTTPPPPG